MNCQPQENDEEKHPTTRTYCAQRNTEVLTAYKNHINSNKNCFGLGKVQKQLTQIVPISFKFRSYIKILHCYPPLPPSYFFHLKITCAHQGCAWGWGPFSLLIHPAKACYWHSKPNASSILLGKTVFTGNTKSAQNQEVRRAYTPPLILDCSKQGGGGGPRGRLITLGGKDFTADYPAIH